MTEEIKNIIFIPSNDIRPLNQLSNTHTLLRCGEALRRWRTNKYNFIIVSGGLTHDQKIQTIPAADIMKKWLISNGVVEDKILNENNSLDTYTNIHYSLKLLKKKNINFDNLTVISHWTHLIRMRIILWRNYKIKPICVPVQYRLSFNEWLHEIVLLFCHLADKTGYGFLGKMIKKLIEKRNSS